MAYSSISLMTLLADAAVDGVVVSAQVALRAGVGHLLDEYDDVHRASTTLLFGIAITRPVSGAASRVT